jgi:hypothetical protein
MIILVTSWDDIRNGPLASLYCRYYVFLLNIDGWYGWYVEISWNIKLREYTVTTSLNICRISWETYTVLSGAVRWGGVTPIHPSLSPVV